MLPRQSRIDSPHSAHEFALDFASGSGTRQSARRGVPWQHGTVTKIPDLGGKSWHTPQDINERGDVAGFSNPLGLTPGMRAELDRQMDGLLGHQMVNDRPRWRRYQQ
jgi:hypothetical protein